MTTKSTSSTRPSFTTLAPMPTVMALSFLLPAAGFAADAAPVPVTPATPATAAAEGGRAPGQAAAEVSRAPAAPAAPAAKPSEKLTDVTVGASAETGYKAESSQLKRATPALTTPQQVTVVSQQVLRDRNAINLKDAVKNSPGITFNAGEGGNSGGDSFNMRGFSARSDIFIDGVRDSALYNRDAFAIEQVEIAKGSSGVYQGRGSTGGSINLVSKTAHAGTSGALDLSASTANSVRAVADVNYDVSKNHAVAKDEGIAMRTVVLEQDGGSPRSTEINDHRVGVLPSVIFGLGTPTQVTISHEFYSQESDGDYGIPFGPKPGDAKLDTTGTVAAPGQAWDRSNYRPAPVDYSNWYGVKGVSHDNTTANITSAIIETKLDEENTLRNVTRYNSNLRDTIIYRPNGAPLPALIAAGANANSNTRSGISGTGSAATLTSSVNTLYTEASTLSNATDLVSNFKAGDFAHTVVVGAEVQQETTSSRFRQAVGPNPVFNLQNPNGNQVSNQTFVFNGRKIEATAETYGLYVNETLHLIKEVDLIAGVRYDRFDAAVKDHAANLTSVNNGAPTAVTPAAPGSFDSSTDMLGWRTGIVLKPTDTVAVYGTLANSFNPSAGDLSLAANTQDLKPEETTLAEVGAKWEPVKDRLSFSAAYFHADKHNLRQTDITNPTRQTLTGQAISQGIEFSTAGAVTKQWNVFGGVSWTTTEIAKHTAVTRNAANNQVTAPDLKGKELTNTPEWAATLFTTFDLGAGWAVGGGVRYMGTRWADAANTASLRDYVVEDLAVYKVINKYCRAQINVDNVANTRFIETARASGDGWATPGAGRTITGTIRFAF